MASRNIHLCLRVPPEVVTAAEASAAEEGIPPAGQGRTGGAAELIRRLLYRHLGLSLPDDPHEAQARAYAAGWRPKSESEKSEK